MKVLLQTVVVALAAANTAVAIEAPANGGARKGSVHHEFGKRVIHPELGKRDQESSNTGVIGLDFHVERTAKSTIPGRIQKRSGDTISAELINQMEVSYLAQLEIGTPAQTLDIVLDTGSSDLWVMSPQNPYCSTNPKQIATGEYVNCTGITFNYKDSSSWSFNSSSTPDFFIQYGDMSTAEGQWGQDDVTIGGATIKQANMAIGEQSNSSACVFGIGLIENESTVNYSAYAGAGSQWPPQGTYMNGPQQMKEQGLIGHVGYSLYLNADNTSSGTVLFGGVDHSKYTGSLQLLPLVAGLAYQDDDFPTPLEFNVVLNTVTATATGGKSVEVMSGGSMPALLDSGTSFVYLPPDVASGIADSLQADSFSDGEGWYLDCDMGSAGYLTFSFSGVTIDVPLNELMIVLTDNNGNPVVEDGISYCQLALMPASDSVILGDSFLRNAYVVYDLENFEVALAQAVFDVSSSSIESIGSSIPSATSAASYSSSFINSQYTASSSAIFSVPSGAQSASINVSSLEGVTSGVASGTLGSTGGSGSGSATATSAAAASSSASATKKSSSDGAAVLYSPIAAIAAAFASFMFL